MSQKWNEKTSYKYKHGTKNEQLTTLGDGNVLMRTNYLISSKPFMIIMGIVLFLLLFFLINYLVNSTLNAFSNMKLLFEGSAKALFSFRNFYMFFPGRTILYIANFCFTTFVVCSVFIKIRIAFKDLNVGQKGIERFATLEEIKKQYACINEKGTPFEGEGGIVVYRDEQQIFIDDSATNTYVEGTTRSGKGELSIRLAIENISRSSKQASMIINDPKLEQYPACKESLEKRGYQVYLLNLLEPTKGIRWNPLALIIAAYKRGDYDEAELLCNTLAHSLYDTDNNSNNDTGIYFINTSSDCLSAMILAVTEDCLHDDKFDNARQLLKFKQKQQMFEALPEEEKTECRKRFPHINRGDWSKEPYIPTEIEYIPTEENEKKINLYSVIHTFTSLVRVVTNEKTGKTALDEYFESRPEFDRAKKKYASVEVAGNRTKGNVFSSALSELTVFTYEGNAKMTSGNDMNLINIGFGDKPIAIFLGVPDYDTSNHFIATSFITQVYFALSKEASRRPGGQLARRIHFFLDEVGNMPKINNLKNQLTMGLGRGLIYHLYVQSDEQLHDIYGETAKTLVDNCGNQVYIKSVSYESSENFSKALGSQTITNINRMGGKFSLHKTYQEQYEERRLLNANQLMNLQMGEFALRRLMKRTDLQGNKITANPIYCHGEHSLKYAYEYLSDFFAQGKTYLDFETGDSRKTDIYRQSYNVTKWMNENLNQSVPVFPDTDVQLLSLLSNAEEVFEQLKKVFPDQTLIGLNTVDAVVMLQEKLLKREITPEYFNKTIVMLGGGS